MIPMAEYARLLGYPPGKPLEGGVLERAREAIAWYARHGMPRAFVRGEVAAFTAGTEVEDRLARLWREDRVDEAYFLDRLAAGIVEELARSYGGHVSPGYRGVPLDHQFELARHLGPESPVEMLPSGMLKPVHSLLAVLTGEPTSCPDCDFRCAFRRSA